MSISRPSLQIVKSTLQEIIHDLEFHLQRIRYNESDAWDRCDPADSKTIKNFAHLNRLRIRKREMKRRLAQLQRAQTEIKREISGDN